MHNIIRTVFTYAMLIVSLFAFLSCCEHASYSPSMTRPTPTHMSAYKMSRSQARTIILNYCETWCENDPWKTKPKLPYKATFESAISGDFDALKTVFENKNYHTGDCEAWIDMQWPMLHAVGDKNFAAFLARLSQNDLNNVLQYLCSSVCCAPSSEIDAYLSRHFPRVFSIWNPYDKSRTSGS
jgi:hypothetical protein